METSGDLLDHWPAMVRVAHSVLGSRDDAEECAASAVAQVVAQAKVDVENYEAYLVTVAKRRALDMRRARSRSWRRAARYASLDQVTVADIAEDVAARAEAVWADAAARGMLSPRVYRLLQMVGDDVPTAQIALELGLTSRAVESHLLRARRAMRVALAQALALIGALAFGLRRMFAGTAPATVAVATFVLMTTPSLAPWLPSSPSTPRDLTAGSPHAYELAMTQRSDSTPAAPKLVASRVHHETAIRRQPTLSPTRSPIATLQGPAHASATVTAGDSGTHEDTPVEMVVACAHNLQVNSEHVGC